MLARCMKITKALPMIAVVKSGVVSVDDSEFEFINQTHKGRIVAAMIEPSDT